MPGFPTSNFNTSSLVMILLVLGVSSYLMWRSQRALSAGRRGGESKIRNLSDPRAGTLARVPPKEIESWQVDTYELVRGWTAQLDNKIRILEQLVADAKEQVRRLEALRARSGEGCPAEATEPFGERPVRDAAGPPSQTTQAAALATAGYSRRAAGSEDSPAFGGTPAKRSSVERQSEVYALADNGLACAEIARQSGIPIGEIELILALRGKAG